MKRELKDHSSSVHQRLLNRAKQVNRPFNELLQYYAIERFLYRFSRSKHKGKAILKGAMMFIVWDAPYARATRDIDMLARLNNNIDNVLTMVHDICNIEVPDDGMKFKTGSVEGERIIEDGNYKGVRVKFDGFLGKARVPMQIDLGFGDVVFPEPQEISYPSMLDMPKPELKGYPRETVIAEKVHVMMSLGIINSRMKDFYDIWLLAKQFDFDSETLEKSISRTFEYRKTTISLPETIFKEIGSSADKKVQWKAFVRKSGLRSAPEELSEVIEALSAFLTPVIENILATDNVVRVWKAPGPWKEK